jgi:hypothetical protein
MADHSTLAVAASISCTIAVCGLFLLIADARLQAVANQEAWAERALQRRRAQAMRASGSSGRSGTTEDLGGIFTVSAILYSILTRPSTGRLGPP